MRFHLLLAACLFVGPILTLSSSEALADVQACQRKCNSQCHGAKNKSKCVNQCRRACR